MRNPPQKLNAVFQSPFATSWFFFFFFFFFLCNPSIPEIILNVLWKLVTVVAPGDGELGRERRIMFYALRIQICSYLHLVPQINFLKLYHGKLFQGF